MQPNSFEFFVYFLSLLQMEAQVLRSPAVHESADKKHKILLKVKVKRRQVKIHKKWKYFGNCFSLLFSMHNINERKLYFVMLTLFMCMVMRIATNFECFY